MILRKMDQAEHGKTRKLWEEVFPEDTAAFLDYYYYIKTRDNSIYVIEEDDDIQAMLQLNPYQILIEGQKYASDYIIAVATRKEYRGRGYMGNILRRALKDMYDEKIPFTFLMPAAEAIYTPYDFRFVYSQKIGEISALSTEQDSDACLPEAKAKGEKGGHHSDDVHIRECVQVRDAALWDAENMSSFFNCNFADRWQVCTARDADYYRTMLLEQQSERGGVRLILEGGQIVGMFAWAGEDGLEIREPLYLEGYGKFFADEVRSLAADRNASIRVYGCISETQSPTLLSAGHSEETDIYIKRCDEILYYGKNCMSSSLVLRLESGERCFTGLLYCRDRSDPQRKQQDMASGKLAGRRNIRIRETEDSDGVIPVAETYRAIVWRKSCARSLKSSEDVIISDKLEGELGKIRKLERVFLNEVV